MLEDDLAQLQALFEAEGDGISRGDIQARHALPACDAVLSLCQSRILAVPSARM